MEFEEKTKPVDRFAAESLESLEEKNKCIVNCRTNFLQYFLEELSDFSVMV